MLRVIVIDDESPARQMIREYLQDFPDIEIIAEAANGPQAVATIRDLAPDLIFLDIQMPGLNGFEVLAQVRDDGIQLPAVIFSTAYDEFAIEAFEVNAVDYLLKPYDRTRFHRAVDRAIERRSANNDLERLARLIARTVPAPQTEGYAEYFMLRSGGKVVPVRTDEIEWIEAADDYAIIHASDAQYVASSGIGGIEKRLNPQTFMRVHRSAIINVTLVRHVEPDGSGGMIATMRSGAAVKVSRGYASELRKLFV